MNFRKIWDVVLIIFSVYWVVFFLLDYWDKHPSHVLAFEHFKYINLSIFLLLLGGGLSYALAKHKKKWMNYLANGIGLYFLGIIIVTAIAISFNKYVDLDIGISNYFHLYGRLSYTLLSVYLIVLACYSAGNAVLKRYYYPDVIKEAHYTYDFGLGAIFLTMLLFLVGAIGQLKAIVVFPILFIFIGINWRDSLEFVKSTFIKSHLPNVKIGFWAYFLMFLLFTFLVINFLAIDIPFPTGFDSRNFYINISNQLAQTNALIEGYQPYSWSLFISQGILLFGRVESTLFMSQLTGVFCFISCFHICHKYFKLKIRYAVLVTLLFAVTPAVANQLFVELKTDFGMLLYQLATLGLAMEWIKKESKLNDRILGIQKSDILLFSLIGLFIGFGLAIKMLNLFFVFALIVGIWYVNGSMIGVIGIVLVQFAFILFLHLNENSGLDKYHLGNNLFKYVYLAGGIACIGYLFFKSRSKSIRFAQLVGIIGIAAILPLSPWVIKNYVETRSLSPKRLLMGTPPGPNISLKQIDQNYKDAE